MSDTRSNRPAFLTCLDCGADLTVNLGMINYVDTTFSVEIRIDEAGRFQTIDYSSNENGEDYHLVDMWCQGCNNPIPAEQLRQISEFIGDPFYTATFTREN
jgi:hypothetical protein